MCLTFLNRVLICFNAAQGMGSNVFKTYGTMVFEGMNINRIPGFSPNPTYDFMRKIPRQKLPRNSKGLDHGCASLTRAL